MRESCCEAGMMAEGGHTRFAIWPTFIGTHCTRKARLRYPDSKDLPTIGRLAMTTVSKNRHAGKESQTTLNWLDSHDDPLCDYCIA